MSHLEHLSTNNTLNNTLFLTSLNQDSCHLRTSVEEYDDATTQAEVLGNLITSPIIHMKNGTSSIFCQPNAWQERKFDGAKKIPETPILKRNVSDGDDAIAIPGSLEIKALTLLPDKCSNDLRDAELSPRLTNMIQSGVVPESPITSSGKCSSPFTCVD